jgi:hypothetical protein
MLTKFPLTSGPGKSGIYILKLPTANMSQFLFIRTSH